MTTKEFEIQYALGTLSKETEEKLAISERTSKKILSILSKGKDWYVRYWVAYNPNTPIEILEKLSKDEDWCVRHNVTKNYNTPIEVKVQIIQRNKGR